ncbi:MAG: TRAP transporter large permease subunit [Treponema sp.]|nr:TRAP transporter large permease subunit [Treponema sp.]
MFTGIVTANESAVLTCIWDLIVALFFYREVTVKDIWPILKRTLRTLAMVMTLIAASSAFGYMMTILRVPTLITQGILGISHNRIVLLLLINFALLILGCVMDMASFILIAAPILVPVVSSPTIGMNPVQFGIVMMLNLSVRLLTPPVRTVLFVGSSIDGIKIEETAKAMVPVYFTMLAVLLLLTFVPTFSITIHNIIFGK